MTQETIGPGSVVASRFRLEDRLETPAGAGLWRAVDLVLSRNVAVHVVSGADPRAPAVLTAARTSATVSDGRILRVLDALEEAGQVYVVHEWGSGSSLDRLVAEAPLEPRRAAWLVREVAEAVAVAHRHGIAHGRLVPENVMVTDAGSVKLIGFVVDAVLHGRSRGDGLSDHEADVRNLGGLLYAALVGKWPGPDESVVPEAPRVHGELCRPRQVRAGIPRPLDALCDRLLSHDVRGTGRGGLLAGRTQPPLESAADVVLVLSEYLGDTVPTASPAPVELPPDPSAPQLEPTVLIPRPADASAPPAPSTGVDQEAPSAGSVRDPDETQAAAPLAVPRAAAAEAPGRPDRPDRHARPERTARTPVAGGVVPPPTWGPDPHPTEAGSSATGPAERPGSVWWRLAALLAVVSLLVLAVVVALALSADPGAEPEVADPTPSAATPPEPSVVLTPSAVDDFDPDQQGGGAPEEHPEQVELAVDGDPATAWETVTYEVGPPLAPYKDGVGLLLDLGREADIGRVAVTLLGGAHDLQLLAAPPESGVPSSTEGLTVAAARDGASGRVTLTPRAPVTTRYLVVWLTALPLASDGYRGRVAEVVVRS